MSKLLAWHAWPNQGCVLFAYRRHTRANPAYVSGVRESQFEAQVTLGAEEAIEMDEKDGDDEEMDGDNSSEEEQVSGDEEGEPHLLL